MARVDRTKSSALTERGKSPKIDHSKKILLEQTIQEKVVMPGMIVRFAYNNKNVYDRRPLLFVFQNDGKLLHGINLNYLNESLVQKFFKLTQAIVPAMEESKAKLRDNYFRIQLSDRRKPSPVGAKLLYNTVIPRDRRFKESYRTYSLQKASSMKCINYDFDIFKQKHGKTTPEAVEKKYEAPLEKIYGIQESGDFGKKGEKK